MTAQALKRETLIAAFTAAMCPDGAVRINTQFQSAWVKKPHEKGKGMKQAHRYTLAPV